MASDASYEQLWKSILVFAPKTPVPLAQTFINKAYSRILNFGPWQGVMKASGFIIPTSYNTGTVTVTQDSPIVTGLTTVWTSSMVGRQFLVGPIAPFYDILTVDTPTQITLATNYIGVNASTQPYAIQLRYVTCPTDFMNFDSVVDAVNNWQLRFNYTQSKIDEWDSRRTSTGTPRILAAAPFTSTGLLRYEIWPQTTTDVSYPFRYRSVPALMSANTDRPVFPIRGDVIKEGALAELSLWPGLDTMANPYYNLAQYRVHEDRFWKMVDQLELENQNQNQTAVDYTSDAGLPYAPIDAAYIQAHGGGL
jgi:hypothetical protein